MSMHPHACRCGGTRVNTSTRLGSWASPRLTGRPTLLRAGSCTMSQAVAHAVCAPPTDVWPLRGPLIGDTRTLAAVAARAAACALASPLWRSSPVASLGTTRPWRPRRWGQRGQSLERPGQRREAEGGWASAEIPVSQHCEGPVRWAVSCRCGGTTRLPLWRHAAPGMSPLAPLAASSHTTARHEGADSRCHRRRRLRTWHGPSQWASPRWPVLGHLLAVCGGAGGDGAAVSARESNSESQPNSAYLPLPHPPFPPGARGC